MKPLSTTPTTTELLEYIQELGKEMLQMRNELNALKQRTDNGARYSMKLNKRLTQLEQR